MAPTREPAPPNFSSAEFRAALGMFATGVTIVTAAKANGELVGLTANSFNSVSLSPALVLWSLSRRAGSFDTFSQGAHYAINVLGCEQQALARRFSEPMDDRFAGVAWTPGIGGAPLLAGAIAHFECANRSQYAEGDHMIFVGAVQRCQHVHGASPLLFHGGRFYAEHPL